MFEKLFTLLFVLLFAGAMQAQSVWSDLPESNFPSGEHRIQASHFRSMKLDVAGMKAQLAAAPLRFSAAADAGKPTVISLPMPEGGFSRFQLEEAPVMHPDLQAKYPEIRTYTGRSLDDPTALLKCDFTPWGFHAMILSRVGNTVFIDPAVHGNTEYYMVYNKKDLQRDPAEQPWTCGTPDPVGAKEIDLQAYHKAKYEADQGDTKLRRYRLALACTGEYAAVFGSTKPLVLAAMNTTMNRVNGVYEIEFAVNMQMIANDDLLIYFNSATDPYTNDDGGTMLDENLANINQVIGVNNYDIGHVFSTGGGGIAGLGVVCGSSKAWGVTGGSTPYGDGFDIDYVAHEMGHQFDGNHTFNNCGGAVNDPAAVEPGSGTTIMAYAGICGNQDVQPHSDDYFQGYNITEMGSYIYAGNGNTCPVKIASSNHNPTVNGGADYTIPKSTPFALTATGSDIDSDTLTYTWDQIDYGNSVSPPSSSATQGALFRSFKGTTSPTRYFPRLSDLVTNTNYTWEKLPGVARTMKFRVVARDNDWFAGCTAEDDVKITVTAGSGPFQVTAPNTAVTWNVGSTQTVTWNVANTTAAPVSCANVRISLSTDGGYTYPVELAASVPNNGTASILVPNNVSNTCRVKVESVGNIFFDISNANFVIKLPTSPTFLLGLSSGSLGVCPGNTGSVTLDVTSVAGFNTPADVAVTGAPAGATVNVTPNPVTPGNAATISISDLTPAMTGNYTLTVTATAGAITRTASIALTVYPGAPGTTALVSPANGATGLVVTPTLSWSAATLAETYQLQVATNPDFQAGSMVSSQSLSATSASLSGLAEATVYYWRVRSENNCGQSVYSPVYAFQTGSFGCGNSFISTNVPVIIDPNSINTAVSILNISQNRAIGDVNVNMAITHSWVGDLSAQLISPSQDTIQLFDRPVAPATDYGCSGSDLDLHFDDEALLTADSLENLCTPNLPSLTGSFHPIEALNVLKGKNALGVWKLRVSDAFAEDGGAITAWSLDMCLPDVIPAGNILVNNPLVVLPAQSGVISNTHLQMSTSGTTAQGAFIVLSLPAHGTLLLNGTPLAVGGVFTQADINSGALTYTHNGDNATTDAFQFDAVDAANQSWVHDAIFNINIVTNNLAATAAESASVLCNGGNSGQITVAASGLDGNYTYSLNGGAGQSSNVFSGLSAGTYTVVVTGQFGLTVAANTITLSEPTAISASTAVSINDVTVTANGGTGALEYSIDGSNFQSSNEFLDLANGVYTVTVRDANGCTSTAAAIVAVNTLQVLAQIQQGVNCNGGSDGSIIVSVGGGTMPYAYSLNGGAPQSSNVFTNLAPGTYTVVVTDDSGFSASSFEVVLTDPDPITVSAVAITNDIVVTAGGGSGSFEYSLDGSIFQSSNQFNNADNGTYTVVVRDSKGCTATTEVTVAVAPLAVTVEVIDINCFGETGTINATATGGIPFYAYSLNGGSFQSSGQFSNLPAGTYSITAKDFEGNQVSLQNIVVNSPDQLVAVVTVTANDGALNISGGVPPYSYETDAPNVDLQDLPNGNYSVTATDAHGCIAVATFSIEIAPVTFTALAQHILCFGGNTGSITVNGSGGIAPYEYSIDGSPYGPNNVFDNLVAGTYLISIHDALGNLYAESISVTQSQQLTLSAVANGSTITATAGGGLPPYKYSLNGGAPQNSGVFSNLAPGTYTIVTTDANGCTTSVDNIVVTVGTVEPVSEWGLSVSPNPGNGLYQLNMTNAPAKLQVSVFDATGRLLQSKEYESQGNTFHTTIDISEFPQGAYLLRLSDGTQWGSVRLSKI